MGSLFVRFHPFATSALIRGQVQPCRNSSPNVSFYSSQGRREGIGIFLFASQKLDDQLLFLLVLLQPWHAHVSILILRRAVRKSCVTSRIRHHDVIYELEKVGSPGAHG